MTLFLHAPNVHQGGGAILLLDILNAISQEISVCVLLDERMSLPERLNERIHIRRIRPTIYSRFCAEVWLLRHVKENDYVLCFGNLPPLFRLRGKVFVFIQNRYLVDDRAPLAAVPFKSRTRLRIEQRWLYLCRGNVDRFVVQTPSMQRLAEFQLGMRVTCLPFAPSTAIPSAEFSFKSIPPRFDFLYVASGESHKNHATLIDAWGLLAEEGLLPTLALTLSPEFAPQLVARVEEECTLRGLRIQNLGSLQYDQLITVYRESGALIYPSGFESFGLPLVEARFAGLAVLAPELDYVRDITDPDETFDPRSPVSIARAVKRHMKSFQPHFKPASARTFLDQLMQVNAT